MRILWCPPAYRGTETPRSAHPPVVTTSGGRLARYAKRKSPALVSGAEDHESFFVPP